MAASVSSLLATMPASLADSRKKYFAQAFSMADVRHLGYLPRHDLKIAMVAALGYKPSKYEVSRVLATCDDLRSEDGELLEGVCLKHFVAAMEGRHRMRDGAEAIRQVFVAFDRRCQGFLALADLKHAAHTVAPRLSNSMLESIFGELDRDGDGRVSYADFDFMMRYRQPPPPSPAVQPTRTIPS